MDIRQRLQKQDPALAGFIAPGGEVQPLEPWGRALVPRGTKTGVSTYEDNVLFSPNAGYSTAIASGAEVQIRIDTGMKKALYNRLSIRMRITNNDAAAIQFCNAYQMIDRIELYANGGNNMIWQATGDGIYEQTMLYDDDKWSQRCRLANTTAAWGTGGAIAAGATAEYWVDLVGNLLEQIKLFAFAPSDAMIFKIKFRPQSVSQQSGAATACTLADLALVFNATVLDDRSFDQKRAQYAAYPVKSRYLNEQTAYFPNQSFTSGTAVALKLNSINDAISHLTITARDSGVVGDNLNAFYDMDDWTFEILDGANFPILTMPLTGKFLRYHEFPERFQSRIVNNKAVYVIPFAADPLLAYKEGVNTGYIPFDGNYQIRITPTASVSKDFYIRAHSYQEFTVSQGQISATN